MMTFKKFFFFSFLIAIGFKSVAQGDFKSEFDSLIEQGALAEQRCQHQLAEVEKASKTQPKGDVILFVNRSTALSMLNLLENYPSMPQQAQQAFSLLLRQDPKKSEDEWRNQPVKDLKFSCGVVTFYKNMKSLIDGKDIYPLQQQDLDRTKKITLQYIDSESKGPNTLISAMVQISLLQELDKAGLLGKPGQHSQELARLHEFGKETKLAVTENLKKNGKPRDVLTMGDLYFEISRTNQILQKTRTFIKGFI